jgi:hypothetical protein
MIDQVNKKSGGLMYWQGAKKIILEIIIIVFSVYVSIWLSNRNNYNQQKKETSDFLSDLKIDLQKEIGNIEREKSFTEKSNTGISGLLKLSPKQIESIGQIDMSITFNTRRSIEAKYEGFKSSGKLMNIEDSHLRNNIISYYQENMSVTTELEKDLNISKKEIIELFGKNDFKAITLNDSQLRIKIQFYSGIAVNLINAYDEDLKKAKEIILEIEEYIK